MPKPNDNNEGISPDGVVTLDKNTEVVETPVIEHVETTAPPAETSSSETPAKEKTQQQEPEKTSTEKTEENVINFDDFLKAKGETVPEKKQPVVEKKEEKVEKLEATPKTTATQKIPRDFTGIDEKDVQLFTNMSNDAFNRLKPLYLSHKQIETELNKTKTELEEAKKGQERIPESYYEHQNAFILSPDFVNQSSRVTTAQAITNHWQQQLKAVKEGSAQYTELQIDPDTGKLSYGNKVTVDASSEATVLGYFIATQQQLANEKSKLDNFISNHQVKHQEASNWVKGFTAKTFPIFDKPENEKLRAVVKDTIKNFHPSFRNNPLAEPLVRAIISLQAVIESSKKQQTTQTTKTASQLTTPEKKTVSQEDIRKAGPISSSAGAAKTSTESEVTFEDFLKRKEI